MAEALLVLVPIFVVLGTFVISPTAPGTLVELAVVPALFWESSGATADTAVVSAGVAGTGAAAAQVCGAAAAGAAGGSAELSWIGTG